MITPEYLRRITERMSRIAEDMEDDMLFVIIMALLTRQGESPYEQLVAIAAQYGAYGYAEIEKAFRHATRQMAEEAGKQAALRVLDQFAQPGAEQTAEEIAKRAVHKLEPTPTTPREPQAPAQGRPTPTTPQEPPAPKPESPTPRTEPLPEEPGPSRPITPKEAAKNAARERIDEILQDNTREWKPEEAREAVEDAAEEAARDAAKQPEEGAQERPTETTEDLPEGQAKEPTDEMPREPVSETAKDASREAVEEAAEDAADDATKESAEDAAEEAEPAVEETKTNWRNLTETEAYASNNAYVNAVDRAYLRVTTEGISLNQAIREAVEELAAQGITMVGTGRREHVDVAVARNLRTAIARLAGDIALKQAIENGYTLVLVSAHLGARPTHEVWQGKVYSIVGDTPQYKDFYAATGYRTKLGLCGINCRHTFAAWKEGMGNPWKDIDPEESRKRYDLEQEQRRMERDIRALKRRVKVAQAEVDAAKPGSDDEKEAKSALRKEKADLAAARKEYKQFCEANGLRELTERLQVYD